jgi:hypothetical protein
MAFLFTRVLQEDDPEDTVREAQPNITLLDQNAPEPNDPATETPQVNAETPGEVKQTKNPTLHKSESPKKLPVATYPLPSKIMRLFTHQVTNDLPSGSRWASFRVSNDEEATDNLPVVTIDLNGSLSTLQKEYIQKFVPNAFDSTNYPAKPTTTTNPPTPVQDETNANLNEYLQPPFSPSPEDAIDFQTGIDDEPMMSTPLHGFNTIHERDEDDSTKTPTLRESGDESDPVSSEEDATVIIKERKKGKRTLRPPPQLTVKLRPRKGKRGGSDVDTDAESEFGGSGGGLDIL